MTTISPNSLEPTTQPRTISRITVMVLAVKRCTMCSAKYFKTATIQRYSSDDLDSVCDCAALSGTWNYIDTAGRWLDSDEGDGRTLCAYAWAEIQDDIFYADDRDVYFANYVR